MKSARSGLGSAEKGAEASVTRAACAFAVLAAAVSVASVSPAVAGAGAPDLDTRLRLLIESYPGVVEAVEGNTLRLASGAGLVIDDGRQKTHEQKLADADIEDMLSQVYPLVACAGDSKPERNFDPGRIRNEAFFKAVYGASEAAVRVSLARVDWFGKPLSFTRTAGAVAALERVKQELAALPATVKPVYGVSAGTFVWRKIAATNRLSVHSFGAAIDLNTAYADYWIWSGGKPGAVPVYKNRIPLWIVEAFERHGFIWGGRWYHYDTMHFEYRPELIAIARAAAPECAPEAEEAPAGR
ncbi:MAG: M15 family metallopeptidase [Hyphomicrobiaceae bacterium]